MGRTAYLSGLPRPHPMAASSSSIRAPVRTPRPRRSSATRRARAASTSTSSRRATICAELARSAGADVLGMAGGDGSLAAVAEVAIEQDVPFVCIPFGTRNHFARDLGLDRDDPVAALAAFDGGVERRVDVGPRRRPALPQQRLARASTRGSSTGASTTAAAATPSRGCGAGADPAGPPAHASASRSTATHVRARLVLVANNDYSSTCSRSASASGSTRASSTSTSRTASAGTWEERSVHRARDRRAAAALRAAIDGEPVELDTPLRFRIEPRRATRARAARARVRGSRRRSRRRARRRRELVRREPAELDEVVGRRLARRRPGARAR